jgi:hypothetical protein
MITPHLLEFELLALVGGSPSARRTCVWSISWDLHRAFIRHAVFLVFVVRWFNLAEWLLVEGVTSSEHA